MLKRRILFSAILALCCAVVQPAAAQVHRAKPRPGIDLRQHPTAGKTPVEVSVGLYVTNLVSIDETRESFEVGGYLTAKWLDPRLAQSADRASDNPRVFQLENLWTPPIEAANSISHRTTSYLLESDRNGLVTYVEKFDAVLSNSYPLRKFPFDSQVLRFEFQPFLPSAEGIRFAPQALYTTLSPERHTELAAWRIESLQYSSQKVASGGIFPETREAQFQISIKRRSGFYLWKIFLPLLMMTMIPALIFWIDPKQIGWLLNVPMTALLSMVAFEFVVLRDLPRIGYITFLDAIFITSFVFCFLSTLEITIAFLVQNGRRGFRIAQMHSAGRWAYPVAYSLVVLFLAISFLA